MSIPVISVILCVRDGADYLSEALDSVAVQRYPALEVIVIDDGSQDDTAVIAKTHPLRPKVVSQGAQGLSAGLNYALRLATGDFLAFLDHDDAWLPGRLEEMLKALQNSPTADATFGSVVNTDSKLTPITSPIPVQLAGAMLIRRESALRVGEFRTDITHAVIIDWIGRAREVGLKFVPLDSVVLLRRVHGSNLGVTGRSEARTDLLRVVRDHLMRKRP